MTRATSGEAAPEPSALTPVPPALRPTTHHPVRRLILRAAQVAFALAVVGFVGWKLYQQWGAVRAAASVMHPRWELVAAASVLTLAIYALMIWTWIVMLGGMGYHLAYLPAARIWSVSNLGKYIPGKIWTITTLAYLTQQRGISPVAATTASILVTLVNTAIGFAVALLFGARLLALPLWVAAVVAVVCVGVTLTPWLLPRLGVLAGKLLGRQIALPRISERALGVAVINSAISWITYGVAFWLFSYGVVGRAPGALSDSVAVFTGSYLLGFVAVFFPAGVGVRETTMAAALLRTGMDTGTAYVLVAASRLWLTVLELTPPLVLLAHHWTRLSPPDGPITTPRSTTE